MSASNDSFLKTVIVAVALCLFCSVLVSGTAVSLKQQQKDNALIDKKRNVLIAANLYKDGVDVKKAFENIEQKFVDMETGSFVEVENPETFDQRKSAKASDTSIEIKNDIARIGRRSKVVPVYLVKENQKVETIILPVHGKGLFSTMYGFVALESDKETVVGLKFYEQGETPGLGGEIDNPSWLALWPGKKVMNDGKPVIELKKSAQGDNQVDALSGATWTTNGVEKLLEYWLGDDGYAPFLAKLDVSRGEA